MWLHFKILFYVGVHKFHIQYLSFEVTLKFCIISIMDLFFLRFYWSTLGLNQYGVPMVQRFIKLKENLQSEKKPYKYKYFQWRVDCH